MISLLVVVFFVLIIAGVPLAFGTGLAALSYCLTADIPITIIAQKIFTTSNSTTMLAIPFFVMAGGFMSVGGLTDKLVNLAYAFVGHVRGSLGHVTTLSSMLFASMSGSSTAAVASIGGMLLPAMKKKGYGEGYAASIVCASAVLGPIIPPSIAFVMYSSITGVSIGDLFMAGIIPGIIMGMCLMTMTAIYARKYNYPTEPKSSWSERWHALVEAIPAIMMPLIIMGGIFGGIFTATEAGAVVSIYCLVVSIVTKKLTVEKFVRCILNTVKVSGSILFIIATSQVLGWILTANNIPQIITNTISSISDNPHVIFAIIILIVFVLGFFLVDAAIITLVTPLFYPLVLQAGIDPLAFAIAFNMCCILGGITPPVGGLLYLSCTIGEISVVKAIKAVWPFVLALLVSIVITMYVPILTNFIPNVLL